jgi:hypothetical protein
LQSDCTIAIFFKFPTIFEERAALWSVEKNQLESNALQCAQNMEQMSVDKTRIEAHVVSE